MTQGIGPTDGNYPHHKISEPKATSPTQKAFQLPEGKPYENETKALRESLDWLKNNFKKFYIYLFSPDEGQRNQAKKILHEKFNEFINRTGSLITAYKAANPGSEPEFLHQLQREASDINAKIDSSLIGLDIKVNYFIFDAEQAMKELNK